VLFAVVVDLSVPFPQFAVTSTFFQQTPFIPPVVLNNQC